MTYYHQQVLAIGSSVYPNKDLAGKMMQAKKYIDRHYASEVTLDQIAREAFVSKFHFIRLFRKYYGRTPYAYLKEVRLARAKEFLRAGVPIRDVCFAVGFESIPSFTRLYKEMTGCPPARFQKRNFR